ncbi:ribbon-helix-helix protein, CopG family [Thermococcus sp. M39]|uniref:ribbon-helix-helix domain-containing protein n=1 Tax=unclassified Thermococcus TaxID=2627626 RepID=UPI00143ABEDF|nr:MULTISPECIES: ribbon-helix-helix domain-containing protein [unclassified Thermococcus]NJE08496.1 ribbon-helix-helix protein, CopG family [Thermococcus sp. M39]NJE13852.1 ribbon-helix-helix protein, CopG family [Thermococcus sp. LS2]
MATTVKISARIPPALAKEMDKLIEAGIYSNRSEIIKEALREFLLRKKYLKTHEDEEFIQLMLRAVEPILAEDWNSEADAHWDNYGGIDYEPDKT